MQRPATVCKISMIAGILVVAAAAAWAQAASDVSLPVTAADHTTLAASYQEKAAAYRQEAAYHRTMVEEYRQKVIVNPKSPMENPWLKSMRKHCQAIIQDSDRLAGEMDRFAQRHRMRAAELQGR